MVHKTELGKQIKKYRNELSLSQDDLAEKIYVTRQTISNWENDKSYPDVNSLVLRSEVFNISIDNLIKGDVEVIKEQISNEDRMQFRRMSNIYGLLLFLSIITPIPLAHFLGYIGTAIWIILMAVTLYVAFLVEKQKKRFDIQTYREILAFTEGKKLDEIAKAREEGKRPYQKILLAFGVSYIAIVISIMFYVLLR